jgi:hypothetical protein
VEDTLLGIFFLYLAGPLWHAQVLHARNRSRIADAFVIPTLLRSQRLAGRASIGNSLERRFERVPRSENFSVDAFGQLPLFDRIALTLGEFVREFLDAVKTAGELFGVGGM